MALSEALFGINTRSTAEGKLADTLADRREEGVRLNTLCKLEEIENSTTALLYLFFGLFVRNLKKKKKSGKSRAILLCWYGMI